MRSKLAFNLATILVLTGTQQMQAGNKIPEVDLKTYLEAQRKNIQKRLNWMATQVRTDAPIGTTATIAFRLDTNGDVSDIKLVKASGLKRFDDACLQDLKNRAPFKPFPKPLRVEATYTPKDLVVTVNIDASKE